MPETGNLLEGVRVLDLTRLLPGPLCTQHLADLGAEVIKIEDPGGGDYGRYGLGTESEEDLVYFDLVNRGKRSLAVDLKQEEGRALFLKLVEKAHVVVESFRPGVMKRLDLGYERLLSYNPAIVYCSITGYGQSGPLADQAGHDLNYCALAGLTEQTGVASLPPIIPAFQIADLAGGTLTASTAILAALYKAQATGEGAHLDVAMADSVLSHSIFSLATYRTTGDVPERGRGILNGGTPCYGVYETADRRFMAVAALEKKFWQTFCVAIDRPDLLEKHSVTGDEAAAVADELATIFSSRSQQEWIEVFKSADCCVSAVLSFEEAVRHPHFKERGIVIPSKDGTDKVAGFSFPAQVSGTSCSARPVSPELGEATAFYMAECGYDEEEVSRLEQEGVVRSP